MKRTFTLIILSLLLLAISFSVGANIQYLYGYDFSKTASSILSGLKTDLLFENQTDNAYFRLSLEFARFDRDLSNFVDSKYEETNCQLSSFPWMLPFVKEAYADIYIGDSTLKVGRFIMQNGSATLYSPSVLLMPTNSLDPFSGVAPLPVDGIKFSGNLSDAGYDFYFVPLTYDSLPQEALYPEKISEEISYGNAGYLEKEFKSAKLTVEASMEELQEQLKSAGLTDSQIVILLQNPELLSNYGFTRDQINQIELGKTLLTLPSTYTVSNITTKSNEKDHFTFSGSNFSFDFVSTVLGYNIKLVATHDHYHFEVPKTINIEYSDEGVATSTVSLYRPARDSLSLDFQGVSKFFDSISYHAEASLIRPERNFVDVNTTYYIPNTDQPTQTALTATSTKISIFNEYYLKAVAGLEYSKGEDLLIGAEVFNSLPEEEFKDKFSLGGDLYFKSKISNISLTGMGLLAFSKIDGKYKPGYLINTTLSYSGIDGFKPSINLTYAYASDKSHPLYSYERLNSIEFSLKAYF